MLEYLKHLFQQLKAHNRKLIDISVIQNRLWVLFKEGGQTEKWLFESSGNLIVSIEGNILDGSWRYISSTSQIIIDCKGLKMLFNQNFLHENVLLLRKDSSELNFLVLFDDKEFSREQFIDFLKDVKKRDIAETRARLNITEIELIDGSKVELIRDPGQSSKIRLGNIVIRNGEQIKEDSIRTKDHKILELDNGKIKNIFFVRTYKLDNTNEIDVKQSNSRRVQYGDQIIKWNSKIDDGLHQLYSLIGVNIESLVIKKVYNIFVKKTFTGKELEFWSTNSSVFNWGYVFINNQFAPDGKYWLNNFKLIKVQNGRIV